MAYQTIIVDDEVAISSGFAKFFPWERLGFEVVGQFFGAEEALHFVQKNTVDVIVSDVIMPGMTGINLARELASMERTSRPLMVLFSAHEEFRYAQQALEYGCSNYILKSAVPLPEVHPLGSALRPTAASPPRKLMCGFPA